LKIPTLTPAAEAEIHRPTGTKLKKRDRTTITAAMINKYIYTSPGMVFAPFT
jgi:hypothetical protein